MNNTTEIKKQIHDDNLRWYVISVVSSQEHMVIENLTERVKRQGLEDDIVDFMVPMVPEVSYKKSSGKKKITHKKLYPGYVFVKSKMDDKIWYIIRNTPGVRLIVGAETRPVPLTDKEYEDMMHYIQEKTERAEHTSPFKQGDIVELKDGEFSGTQGVITEIDNQKGVVYVSVEILGRTTPMMVPFEKIDKID
ncbi:transcription termination/antitermination protein NusG [Candidatus Absconditicoccus praedator]|uniref:transcription termination/antitermination protein NusG n=1 Tax=Candidatus Absconditicoccus praedator TaxID=2735562 RepID=UPI001E52401C|nr:transcription termination/antitermination protein NusG [Candidatus Absconditicoccus praedator]UFX83242.1 transcription termination/antitermination factor NusG [Candidatus Absconditicoccus praedator]